MRTISNQPPKGTADWFPEEYAVRKYIFDTWRRVCIQFGYEEYLTPIIESAEVYRAKSGEDVGGKELMTMVDRAGRELSIRPEMTPSVTRMVTRVYPQLPKPIRYFSIANYLRNEKPQRGRNREFWQLNFDIFGSESINADIEILQMGLEIMLAFNAPVGSFTMFINNRKLIDYILNDVVGCTAGQKPEVVRAMDKWEKLTLEDFKKRLAEIGLDSKQSESLVNFMASKSAEDLQNYFPTVVKNEGFIEIQNIIKQLTTLGYEKFIKFQPNIIRGFDYYDGMVFEVFDNNPENSRSMFGGGRYNGLASIFGAQSFPAVGCAPGDETTKLFLEAWNLIPETVKQSKVDYYVPILKNVEIENYYNLVKRLRSEGKNVLMCLEQTDLGKALKEANNRRVKFTVILGEDEVRAGVALIKNMSTGEQEEYRM